MRATDKVTAKAAIRALDRSADAILLVDGDRDHMNPSRLTCEHTATAAKLMREVSGFLQRISA